MTGNPYINSLPGCPFAAGLPCLPDCWRGGDDGPHAGCLRAVSLPQSQARPAPTIEELTLALARAYRVAAEANFQVKIAQRRAAATQSELESAQTRLCTHIEKALRTDADTD